MDNDAALHNGTTFLNLPYRFSVAYDSWTHAPMRNPDSRSVWDPMFYSLTSEEQNIWFLLHQEYIFYNIMQFGNI
jgi:hypothetical protein